MPVSLAIIGGGPAGVQAATHAARLGADVTLFERDVMGGAANLWDCIPSKAMIAAGGIMNLSRRAEQLGLGALQPTLDPAALKDRIAGVSRHLERSVTELLSSQGVEVVRGTARLVSPHRLVADTEEGARELDADAVLLSTGSRPRIPPWADIDGERVLTTRDAYPPKELPAHLVVIGSGVTGVEFTHMFRSLGARVTLIVSRQQVLPNKDPEVAAALENDFISTGVRLLKGARAEGIERSEDGGVAVRCDDGRVAQGS